MEMYKDDWNKVCEHVGTRTQDECILKFLQLPIEDPYLEGNGTASGPLAYPAIPFSQSGNPVMSTVAFLASVVDPRVASAAAKAALEEFSKTHETISATTDETTKETTEATTVEQSTDLNSNEHEDSSKIKQEKVDVNESDESKKMEVNDTEEPQVTNNDESTTASSSSSTIPKPTTNTDQQDPRKLLAAEINDKDIKAAAASALAAASVKAKYLASIEERKIKSLVAQVVEMQIKKLEIKLKHFEELESIM
ncbi:unnamed protein product, partial [Adineta ricciae]